MWGSGDAGKRVWGTTASGVHPFAHSRARILVHSLVILLSIGLPIRANAHGEPASLADWGGFGRFISSCQRAIGRAGFLCGIGTWDARRRCFDSGLRGQQCDEDATDEAAAEARSRGIRLVQDSCSFQELQNLRFVDLAEAQLDVIRFCAQLETAVVSAVYGPSDTTWIVSDENEVSCRLSAADAANKLLHFAFHARLDAMDRIAASVLALSSKQEILDHSQDELQRARLELEQRLERQCADSIFQELYGRDPGAFLEGIAERAECLVDATYAQGAVLCPAPFCGNGIQEPGEQCDDGNDDETDTCTSACRNRS